MSTVVRISDELANDAKHRSKVEQRSMTAQLEYWAKIGKAAEDNPDLPFAFIKETMVARSEIESSYSGSTGRCFLSTSSQQSCPARRSPNSTLCWCIS